MSADQERNAAAADEEIYFDGLFNISMETVFYTNQILM